MKHLKQKLMAATAMMMVSVVMLTSASFAWFSISVAPEVKTITTSVTANHNLEPAYGTDEKTSPTENTVANFTEANKNNIWGGLVELLETDAATGIGPAMINDGELQYVVYGDDGRPSEFAEVTLPKEFVGGKASFKDGKENTIGQSYLIWLRTNVEKGTITATFEDIKFLGEDDEDHVVMAAIQVGKWNSTSTNETTGAQTGTIAWADTLYPVKEEANGYQATFFADGMPVNEPVPILIHVYLDGPQVTNEMLSDAEQTAVIGNIMFESSAITSADKSYVGSYDGNQATNK